MSTEFFERFSAEGLDHFMKNFAQYEAMEWSALERQPVMRFLRDIDAGTPVEELDKRPDRQFLQEQAGIRRIAAVRLNDNSAWFDALSFVFEKDVRHIDDAILQRAIPFLWHFKKAIEIGRTFTRLRERYNAALSVLNQVNIGLILTLQSGEIIVVNTELCLW